jgi:hypothetical protein
MEDRGRGNEFLELATTICAEMGMEPTPENIRRACQILANVERTEIGRRRGEPEGPPPGESEEVSPEARITRGLRAREKAVPTEAPREVPAEAPREASIRGPLQEVSIGFCTLIGWEPTPENVQKSAALLNSFIRSIKEKMQGAEGGE